MNKQTLSSQGNDKGRRSEPVKFEMHKESMFGMDGLLGKTHKKTKNE